MTPPTNAQIDPVPSSTDNGDGRATASRGLMVREYESQALSPYMGAGPGGMYVDGMPAGLSFSQLAHSLRRRWLLALIAGVLVGLPLAAVVWLVTPDNYEVVAWLRVGDAPDKTSPYRIQSEYDSYRKTQAARIRSPLVLLNALKDGVAELPMLRSEREPMRFLEDEIVVTVPLEQELLQIKMRGKDPTQLVRIVNAVRDSYIENVVQAENRTNLEKHDLLEKTLSDLTSEISAKQSQLVQIQLTTKSTDLPGVRAQSEMLLQQSASILHSIRGYDDELGKIETKLAVLKKQREQGFDVPEYLVRLYLNRDDTIAGYAARLSQLQMARDFEIGNSRKREKDPAVKNFTTQIDAVKHKNFDQRRAELRPEIIRQIQSDMNKENGQDMGDPEKLMVARNRLVETIQNLKSKQMQVETDVSNLGRASAELKELHTNIEDRERFRAKLQEEFEQVKIALKMPARVTALDKAQMPEGSNPVFRIVMTIFSGIAGFLLGCGGVVAMEYQAHRLNTGGELSSRTGLRVLGTVPNLEALSRAKGINGAAALQGILAESVDSIRTILLQQSRADAPRVILVTSAGDREGKTTVAAHLAASLARSGRRTLLVDGDLRSPTIHAMFSATLEPGLCEMLRGEVDLEGAIQPTQVDGMMLVSAGQCDYQAIAALARQPLKDVLQKAREQFEFVVIDGAPVLNYADTLLMGAQVDAAVLSARRDVSQLPKVYEARERLESVGIRVLGAVVNGITETSRRPAYALPSPN